MRRVTLQMYVTLDGRNEFPTYPGSGDPPNDDDVDVSGDMWTRRWADTDTLLFDRVTYEQWAEFWPLSKRTSDEHPWYRRMSEFVDRAQKVVFSESFEPSGWANTRVVPGDIDNALRDLTAEEGRNLAVVAPELAKVLMRSGRIDDYLFCVFPVILGRGVPLYGDMNQQQTLRLVEVKRFGHGELFLHYEVLR